MCIRDRLEVASVGHDGGELLEGVELVHATNYQVYQAYENTPRGMG